MVAVEWGVMGVLVEDNLLSDRYLGAQDSSVSGGHDTVPQTVQMADIPQIAA